MKDLPGFHLHDGTLTQHHERVLEDLEFFGAESASANHYRPGSAVHLCGNPEGCECTSACEWPCWQRQGLTGEQCRNPEHPPCEDLGEAPQTPQEGTR